MCPLSSLASCTESSPAEQASHVCVHVRAAQPTSQGIRASARLPARPLGSHPWSHPPPSLAWVYISPLCSRCPWSLPSKPHFPLLCNCNDISPSIRQWANYILNANEPHNPVSYREASLSLQTCVCINLLDVTTKMLHSYLNFSTFPGNSWPFPQASFSLVFSGSVHDICIWASPEANPRTGVQVQAAYSSDLGNTSRRVGQLYRKESQLQKGQVIKSALTVNERSLTPWKTQTHHLRIIPLAGQGIVSIYAPTPESHWGQVLEG